MDDIVPVDSGLDDQNQETSNAISRRKYFCTELAYRLQRKIVGMLEALEAKPEEEQIKRINSYIEQVSKQKEKVTLGMNFGKAGVQNEYILFYYGQCLDFEI